MKKIIFIISNLICFLFIVAIFSNNVLGQKELIGKEAPSFTLKSINDNEISLKNFRGKVVLLDFWATWCGPCRIEMQHLKKVYEEYKEKNFIIISIDLYEDLEKVKKFIDENNIEWIVAIDKDGQVTKEYRIQAIPTLILIDPKGMIVDVYIGVTDENILKDKIKTIMQTTTTEIINTIYTTIKTTHYVTITKSELLTLTTYKTEISTFIEYTTITQTYSILEGISIQWIAWLITIIFTIVIVIIILRKYKYAIM